MFDWTLHLRTAAHPATEILLLFQVQLDGNNMKESQMLHRSRTPILSTRTDTRASCFAPLYNARSL